MLRKIVQIDEEKCDGCGQCIPSCAEGAIALVRGKAVLSAERLCDGLGACLGECPRGALQIIEREAERFEEDAIRVHAAHGRPALSVVAPLTDASGCPGSRPVAVSPGRPRLSVLEQEPDGLSVRPVASSRLRQWPVQIALVSPRAPDLEGADLLIAADCVPFALPDFHDRLLSGRRVLVGCPKLDDVRAHIGKLSEIFRLRDVRSITVARMEVPCCGGLMWATREALRAAGKSVPLRDLVVGIGGEMAG